VVQQDSVQVKEIAKILGKQGNYVSNILAQLQEYKLVSYTKEWRNHYYHASIDAYIAYSVV
jgi:DNA-binding transcriptional regulator GbsR (MarR family)